MGKESHLNPILSSDKKKVQNSEARSVRRDKLHDIKIPISPLMDTTLRFESRREWNGSKTAIGTAILRFGLEHIIYYPDVTYKDYPDTVHCKVDHETFLKIGNFAAIWKCSVRKAAHRIFIEAYKKKQLGGLEDGEI